MVNYLKKIQKQSFLFVGGGGGGGLLIGPLDNSVHNDQW